MSEGIDIARQRIAEEAKAKTGFLDLGNLGLTRLPDELFELEHLQALNLGSAYRSKYGEIEYAFGDFEDNSLGDDLSRLKRLPWLKALHMDSVGLSSLRPISNLKNLNTLD